MFALTAPRADTEQPEPARGRTRITLTGVIPPMTRDKTLALPLLLPHPRQEGQEEGEAAVKTNASKHPPLRNGLAQNPYPLIG